MDKKIWAIAIVAVLIVAGAATYVVVSSNDDDDISYDSGATNIIARVNSEGSGLFISSHILDPSASIPTRASNGIQFFDSDYRITYANADAWGGLVFSDPGASSIQHTQLASIAAAAGLGFKQYTAATSLSNNTLYYHTNLSNYGTIVTAGDIDGGIIWEPQYQRVIQEDSAEYTKLALTNDLFPGHTCCVIAGNHNWLENNSDTTARFLAGYADGVNFLTDALADKTSDNYAWLVNFAKTNMASGTLSESEVKAAFDSITYLYADDSAGSLSKLTGDIASLATSLSDLGLITSSKFSTDDAQAFAEAFVDDSYLKNAVSKDFDTSSSRSVKVAVINGDIHQIAIQIAVEKKFFDNYNIRVTLNSSASSGGDIATLLTSGDTNIGFLGAPPATTYAINGEHILV